MLDRESLAGLLASIASSVGIVAAYSWQYVQLIPVGAILLTASMGYFFTRLNQSNVRKYEVRALAVKESLGPIYGEILKIQNSLDSCEAEWSTTFYSEWSEVWSDVRLSHRFYVIPKTLASDLETYFNRLALFHRRFLSVLARVQTIEFQTWPKIFDLFDVSQSAFIRINGNDEPDLMRMWMQGALFWNANPNDFAPQGYRDFSVTSRIPNVQGNQFRLEGDTAIRKAVGEFWAIAAKQADNDEVIRQGRKGLGDLRQETSRIRLLLESEFEKWAGK